MIGILRTTFYKILNRYYKRVIIRTCKKYEEPLRVNGQSYVNANTYLGKNVNFNGLKIHGEGKVIIGDNFHSGIGCSLITQTHNYMGNKIPYDETYLYGDIVIEDNVWLGQEVIVLPGITIGEGAIIQAGSVVVKDIPKYAIAGGHPATVFKQRDIEHYNRLKQEGKFH